MVHAARRRQAERHHAEPSLPLPLRGRTACTPATRLQNRRRRKSALGAGHKKSPPESRARTAPQRRATVSLSAMQARSPPCPASRLDSALELRAPVVL